MSLPFRIALRFLKSSIGQTLLIAFGIAVGVSVQIFIGLLIQGLQQSLLDRTVGNSPHITINSMNADKKLKDWESLYEKAKNTDASIKTISASLDSPAFLITGDRSDPVVLRGFTLSEADKIYKFKSRLINGSLPQQSNQVLMGKQLAENLKLQKGDTIEITTPTGKKASLTISGIFDLKVLALNKSWLVSSLDTAKEVLGEKEVVTSIEMQVKDIFQADKISKNIKEKIGSDTADVLDWKSQNQELLSGLNGQSVSSYMIQVFVMISVVLAIASILAITVMQKSRQLGILKAMGIRDSMASKIFLYEGLLLGVIGAFLGIVLGLGLLYSFKLFAKNPDGTPVVDIYFNYPFIGLSAVIAILAAVLASLIPARRSSKLNPIEVIRNG